MKFFIYSKCGECAGLGLLLQNEGNGVQMYIKEPDYRTVYKGLLDQSSKIDKDAIVIFDSSGMGIEAERLRRDGYTVFGASKFHDKLESDREFGIKFMTDHDIEVPDTYSFSSSDWDQAFKLIKLNKKKRFVFKPSGDLPSKLTYSCSDSEDLIMYMKYVQSYFGSKIKDFVLQEFVEGQVLSTEFFVGPNGFFGPVNQTIEVKKFMNDDLGPSTGCAGNIVWFGDENDPTTKAIRKIESSLIKERYIGAIDLNCIINDEGIYGLEWTPRFGLDAFPTFLQLLRQDAGQFISDCVDGETDYSVARDAFAGGIRITIPPYPIEQDNIRELANKGIPIRGLDEDHSFMYEVMKDGENLVHSDGTGVIAVVSDWGSSIKECLQVPRKILEDCKIPDKQFRTDLGEVLPKMYSEVKEMISCQK